VDAFRWLLPLDLSRRDLDALALASVTVPIESTSPRSTTAIRRKDAQLAIRYGVG
jgi:hypothetical protein